MRLYFDYAASTPIDRRVRRAMDPYLRGKFGNPGSLHAFGQEAIAALDRARETIAASLDAGFREIVFTGSATEANNLALRGAIKGLSILGMGSRNRNLLHSNGGVRPRIVVSAIEHESIRETARDLEHEGIEIITIPVDRRGVVDLKKIETALHERTVLVSVMYADNEIGTIQPIPEIAKIIRDFRKQRAKRKGHALNHSPFAIRRLPLFHTDAVQAFQFLDCNVGRLGVDLMTLSAHKIYGPKGVGALYVREHIAKSEERIANPENSNPYHYTPFAIHPMLTGGGQEFGLRSGTENVPSLVGFAKAVELAIRSRRDVSRRLRGLRDYLVEGIRNLFPSLEVNGMGNPRLPNIANVHFPGRRAEDLLTAWSISGLCVSSGSACRSRSALPSHVLTVLGMTPRRARESVRFSLGSPTTRREIDKALQIIKISLREKP